LAVADAAGDHPERIDDAVACMDVSELTDEDRTKHAPLLARRLYAVVDRVGVTLSDVPEQVDTGTYIFYRSKPTADQQSAAAPPDDAAVPEDRGAPLEIVLTADAGGLWRFAASTLAAIPDLEEGIREKPPPAEAAAPEVPAARRSPRAAMMTFLNAMNADPKDIQAAVACLDPTGREPATWGVAGEMLAVRLKTVMDKIAVVVPTEIPDTPDGEPYVWYTSGTGNIVIGRVAATGDAESPWDMTPGEWRFTPQTLKTVNALYVEREDDPILAELSQAGVTEDLPLGLRLQRSMPERLRVEFLGVQTWQWLALTLLFLAGWVLKGAFALVAGVAGAAWLKSRSIDIDHAILRRALRSAGAAVTVLFWWYTVPYLQLPASLLDPLLPALGFALVLTVVWVGYRVVDIVGGHIATDKDLQLTRMDDVLIPLLRKILKVMVVLVVGLVICAWFGEPPWSILGALGIGGVAVALAAQETLGNFFGSITVLFDRPFGIGDWIVLGDVEGTVERVGFRSTRVRTFYNSVITIPNAKMVNTQVDNYGARRFRRVRIMLSVTYNTPAEKIDAFCEGIRELIRLHPYTRKDYYHVYFNQFAASSLDIILYAFFETPDWGTELRERHRLFLDILRLAERLGVDFAFPTQTVWLERSRPAPVKEEHALVLCKQDADAAGLSCAAAVFHEAYGPGPRVPAPVIIPTAPRSVHGDGAGRSGTGRIGGQDGGGGADGGGGDDGGGGNGDG
ncbi:MAG: mechanosensitive ion channel family protein, partial [Phycisphaerae bacterium]